MNRFAIATPKDYTEAGALLTDARFKLPILKGGGMDVVDHLKEGLIEPDLVIDVRKLRAEGGKEPVSGSAGELRIEAATRNFHESGIKRGTARLRRAVCQDCDRPLKMFKNIFLCY